MGAEATSSRLEVMHQVRRISDQRQQDFTEKRFASGNSVLHNVTLDVDIRVQLLAPVKRNVLLVKADMAEESSGRSLSWLAGCPRSPCCLLFTR